MGSKSRKGVISSLTSDEFSSLIKNSNNYTDALNKLGLFSGGGGNFKILKFRILDEKIDTSHFHFTRNLSEESLEKHIIPLEEILVKDSNYTSTGTLKNRLLKKGLLKERCYKCGIGNEWNGEPLTLQLDHINGNNRDNRIENLRLLCPNCHSQTETFTGKRLKKIIDKYCANPKCMKKLNRTNVSGYCIDCYYLFNFNSTKLSNKPNEKKANKKPSCLTPNCNNQLSINNKTGLCSICYDKVKSERQRTVERPSKNDLLTLILTKSFLQISKEFGVSDNAIRKWCKFYGLPYRKKDLTEYINNYNIQLTRE